MEVTESGVNIVYSDGAGYMHGVQAKHAIVAVPPMVAARILKNLDNASKASMLGFRYGSYLVANCFFSKPVYDGSFSNWYSAPFTFSNILIATETYKKEGLYAKDMGQALTIYQPYLPGSEGRTVLLEGDRTKLSQGILEQLAPNSSQLEASLDSIVLSRWGHAMPVMNVGYFARMARLTSMEHAHFSLSHSSSQGMQCAESAVLAARLAVNQALKVKAQAKPLIFFDSIS
jgi:protoporphyrinogen oxidase